jgi:hypothetical protein
VANWGLDEKKTNDDQIGVSKMSAHLQSVDAAYWQVAQTVRSS